MYSCAVEISHRDHLRGRVKERSLLKYTLRVRLLGLNLFRERRYVVFIVMQQEMKLWADQGGGWLWLQSPLGTRFPCTVMFSFEPTRHQNIISERGLCVTPIAFIRTPRDQFLSHQQSLPSLLHPHALNPISKSYMASIQWRLVGLSQGRAGRDQAYCTFDEKPLFHQPLPFSVHNGAKFCHISLYSA